MRSLLLVAVLAAGAAVAAPPKRPAAARKPARPAAKKPVPAKKPALLRKPTAKPPNRGALGSRGALPLPAARAVPVAVSRTASQVPAARPAPELPPTTLLLTGAPYRPGLDLKTDLVAVRNDGASPEEIERILASWQAAGYPVHRVFPLGEDPGGVYSGAKPGEADVDRAGAPLSGGTGPVMVPTTGWLEHLKEQVRRAVDAGAEGVSPDASALMTAAGGYSPAFKAAWQELFQMPWQEPHASPAAFFNASRLRSDLYLRALDELLRYTKEYGRQKGREVRFYLPLPSPVAGAAVGSVFPYAMASRLPVDGVISLLAPGTGTAPYQGKPEPASFEQAWLSGTYFANLMDGQEGKSLHFVLGSPPGTDAEAVRTLRPIAGASLLLPQAHGVGISVDAPGAQADAAAAAPPDVTGLSALLSILQEAPRTRSVVWTSGATRGIGILALDTLAWQRGGPGGSSMRSLYGLALPLLKRGIPVELVPGERVADRGFLSRFKVLLVSYDMQKPLGPELNAGLVDWIKAGGSLIFLHGSDPYNDVPDWWNRSGFTSPADHLIRQCGAVVDLAQRGVRPARAYAEVLKSPEPDGAGLRTYSLAVSQHQAAGKPVYVRFSDRTPEDGSGLLLGRVRVLEGPRVRADFRAGSVAERAFRVEDLGSRAGAEGRTADADASFVYRFTRLSGTTTLELELGGDFRVEVASGEEGLLTLEPAESALPALRVTATYPVVSYPLLGATALYRARENASAPAWWAPVGAGSLVYCGLPAAFGADSAGGADLVRGLVRYACGRTGLAYQEGPLIAHRTPYVIAHSLGRTAQLKGQYLDLLHPDLPLVENQQLPYREPGIYKEVRFISRIPGLLHGSHRARVLEATAARLRVLLDGPEGGSGTLRVYPAGMSLADVEAVTAAGRRVAVETRIEGRTIRVRYPQSPGGLTLSLRWIRPEQRLTK